MLVSSVGADGDTGRDRREAPEGAAPLLPDDPRAIGRYTVLGRLGAGGMGTVYLGRSEKGRRVAIKVIRSELAEDEAFVRRFHHEVAAARRVAGFCTARVLDAGLDVPRPYLVTEYVDGLRLDHAIERDGPLDDSSLEGFAVGVIAALTAIHSAGVVHRDLKPGNVILARFGPRVIDFGIARALDDTSVLTRVSSIMGTPGWMSPEQFEKQAATPVTDVFAWGGLVAYAATGRQPYGDGPLATVAYRVMHEPVDLTGLEDDKLRRVVEAALRKDPAERPTAREILLDLLGEEAGGDTGEAVTTALQRTWSGPSPVAAGGAVARPGDAGAPPPPDAAAAAAADISTTEAAAASAHTRDAVAAGAEAAAAAADPTRRFDGGQPLTTKPVEPIRPDAERLLPAAGQPLPPGRDTGLDRPRRPDPNRPLPSAGLPMPDRPARQPRQRSAQPTGGTQAPPVWPQPAPAPGGHPGYGTPPSGGPAGGPYRQSPQRQAPYYEHPYRDPRSYPGQQGRGYPPQGQGQPAGTPPRWNQQPYGQPAGWQQPGRGVATRQGGAPDAGQYQQQAQRYAGPTAGYRVRRFFAYLLTWGALFGVVVSSSNGSTVAVDNLSRAQERAALLAFSFAVLVFAFLLLPASRQKRGRAVTARVLGVVGMALAVAGAGQALSIGDLTQFRNALGLPFLLLTLGIFLYPKDRARQQAPPE